MIRARIATLQKLCMACIMLLVLAACDDPFYAKCIEGDDWGDPKTNVSAKPDDIISDSQDSRIQSVHWKDSGKVVLNADQVPFIFKVGRDDQWTSWYEGDEFLVTHGKYCQYLNNGASNSIGTSILKGQGATENGCTNTNDPDMFNDCNAACWLKDGFGLYVLFGDATQGAITKHLGDYDGDGYQLRIMPSALGVNTGDKVQFKIHDREYENNSGGYTIRMIKGVKDPDPGPLETIVTFITDTVDDLSERLYKGIVTNETFIRIVQLCLVLYITLYGMAFMYGMQGQDKGDFVIHVFKFGLLAALIGPESWEFFKDHLFDFFTGGAQELAARAAGTFSDFDPSNPWYALDNTLRKFYSPETQMKVTSLAVNLKVAGLGPLMFLGIELGLLLYVVALLFAMKVFIQAYVLMALMIVIFPVFLIFILFTLTKSLFDEWLDQMIAYALQIILLFAAVGMFIALIMHYMEMILGYQICWRTWLDATLPLSITQVLPDVTFFKLKYYLPSIEVMTDDGGFVDMVNMYMMNDEGQYVLDQRFADAPYLDPCSADLTENAIEVPGFSCPPGEFITSDMDKLLQVDKGHIVTTQQVLVFIAATFLMWKFLDFLPNLLDEMKGGTSRQASSPVISAKKPLFSNIGKALGFSNAPTTESMGKKLDAMLDRASGWGAAKKAVRDRFGLSDSESTAAAPKETPKQQDRMPLDPEQAAAAATAASSTPDIQALVKQALATDPVYNDLKIKLEDLMTQLDQSRADSDRWAELDAEIQSIQQEMQRIESDTERQVSG